MPQLYVVAVDEALCMLFRGVLVLATYIEMPIEADKICAVVGLSLYGREPKGLSVTDDCRDWSGDVPIVCRPAIQSVRSLTYAVRTQSAKLSP
jgi:hypothetical protein